MIDSITVDGITHILTSHAVKHMRADKITLAQVEETVADPDRIEIVHSGRTLYIKTFYRPNGTVAVVVEEADHIIVTIYKARRLR